MSENETIAEYNVRVLDIANESFTLREKISETKLVKKKYCSLYHKMI